jgi:hypothetical protein
MEKVNRPSEAPRAECSDDLTAEDFFGGEYWAIRHNEEIVHVSGGFYKDARRPSPPAKYDALKHS